MITAFATIGSGNPTVTLHKNIDPSHADSTLPIVLEYLAEGAANVVLRLVPLPAASKLSTAPPELVHKVLRLRKAKPSLASAAAQYAHLTQNILPLFAPGTVAQHTLVSITPDLLQEVNALLPRLENRHPSRAPDTVDQSSPHALLVEDLSLLPPGLTLEFKPKWLLQSPGAPPGSKRCRTCALRALRRGDDGFCPLALRGDGAERRAAAEAILAANGASWALDAAEGLAGVLAGAARPVLDRLAELQGRLDPGGILALGESEEPPGEMLLAMTVRDCAVFVRIRERFDEGVEVRLADLDAKLGHAERVDKWRATERALVEQGWYTNTEQDGVEERVCVLARKGSK